MENVFLGEEGLETLSAWGSILGLGITAAEQREADSWGLHKHIRQGDPSRVVIVN